MGKLTQRLLDIIRIFNNPENYNLFIDRELIPQDIDYLRENGLMVDVLEKNSLTVLCRISKNKIETKKISDSIIIYFETIKAKLEGRPQSDGLAERIFIEDLKTGIFLKYFDVRQNLDECFLNDIYIALCFRANNSPNNKPLEMKNLSILFNGIETPVIVLGEMWINELRVNPKDLYETAKIIAAKTGRTFDDISEEFIKMLCKKAESLDGKPRSLRTDSEIGIFFKDDEDGHINAIIKLLEVMDNVFGTNFLALYKIANENASQRILKRTNKSLN